MVGDAVHGTLGSCEKRHCGVSTAGSEVYQDALVAALAKRLKVRMITVEADRFLLVVSATELTMAPVS